MHKEYVSNFGDKTPLISKGSEQLDEKMEIIVQVRPCIYLLIVCTSNILSIGECLNGTCFKFTLLFRPAEYGWTQSISDKVGPYLRF